MAKNMEVNISSISSDLSQLEQLYKQITQDMKSLKESMDSLSGSWSGPAQTAFVSQFNSDYQIMNNQLENIKHIKECMQFAKEQYTKCESTVESTVASIRI